MATALSRLNLQAKFQTGLKPSADDFADLFESFINFKDNFNNDDDLDLAQGIKLGDSTSNEAGTIRWNGTAFEGHDGTGWSPLGSGGVSSVWSQTGSDISFNTGNVGIDTSAAPVFLLDVAPNTDELVRFGNAVVGGNSNQSGSAWFSHAGKTLATQYALIQESNGRTILNSEVSPLLIQENGVSSLFVFNKKLGVNTLPISHELQVDGDILATGTITPGSDKNIKKNVKDFEEGFELLEKLNPVSFKYNGKAGTKKDKKGIGLIAQDVEKVFPDIVTRAKRMENNKETEILALDYNSLIFVLINAVKELEKRISKMEK